jgi:2-methylcitrate dehydratase PrpD
LSRAYSDSEQAVLEFTSRLTAEDLPPEVVVQGRRCLLDLAAAAAGGFLLPQATIVREHVAASEPSSTGARVMFDGRRVAPTAAAWASATAIESLDLHDGHSLAKGHAGVALLAGLLAVSEVRPSPLTDSELLAAIVKGYELAIRCGLALHSTAPEYHSSGAWNCVATAVVCCAILGGSDDEILHAAGIAEYFGPRGPMMRCIAAPSMVKDSSAWGSRVGVEAALLALRGFTGRPAEVLSGTVAMGCQPERGGAKLVRELFSDLGRRWRILELYFKPYPVCRWAQPAVEAALELRARDGVAVEAVERIEIASFRQAVALGTREPADTEEAQYSLSYAVAAALRFGRLGVGEVTGPALADPQVLRLSRTALLVEVPRYSERFPTERLADVALDMRDGRRLERLGAVCRGDPSSPLQDDEIAAKFRGLVGPLLGGTRAAAIEDAVNRLAADSLVDLLLCCPSESLA